MKKVYIYGLCDPRTEQLRYVGKTNNYHVRAASHIYEATSKGLPYNQGKNAWINDLLSVGLSPDMFILEESDAENGRSVERFWIGYFLFVGCDLLNIRGVKKMPSRHRRKHTPEEVAAFQKERDDHESAEFAIAIMQLIPQQRWAIREIIDQFAKANIPK